MSNETQGAAFWDERYQSAPAVWSGRANPRLIEHVTDLTPGHALDVGSGEGADALWLAQHGWNVTGIDVSAVALDRAAEHLAAAGDETSARVSWHQADLLAWSPAPSSYDLISAQFMHLPPEQLATVHQHLAAAVRPGGTLLIVGHHPSDKDAGFERPRIADMLFEPDAVTAVLYGGWDIVVAEAVPREATHTDGTPATIHDTVVRARRR